MAYQREPYPFNAGRLGRIEGLTITLTSQTQPVASVHYFGGLPYALPPIGEYRFQAPRKLPRHYRYGTAVNPGRFTGGTGICPQPPNRNPPDPSLFDEDCLQLNIWKPTGDAPAAGWPVFFYLHGGYLQWGSANWKPEAPVRLLNDSAFRAIIVVPAYRLNALGFLTGQELADEAKIHGQPVGNMGFWDQRTALEWTRDNIAVFGGDPTNVTVAGYSAGAFSAFHQLAHELYLVPVSESVIRRVVMLSNGPGLPAKTLKEHQAQFDEYTTKLGISPKLDGAAKLAALRNITFQQLIDVQKDMTISEFRVLADGTFVPRDLSRSINSGDFAQRMKTRGVTLLSGECRDEHTIYYHWRTPADSCSAVYTRLCAEYPERIVAKLMQRYCGLPTALNSDNGAIASQKGCCGLANASPCSYNLPAGYEDWRDFFGRIYAKLQVHCMQRGSHNALFKGGLRPGKDVLRYRFDRRLECVDETMLPEWGVTHASDIPIWLWGFDSARGLTDQEKGWLQGWNEGFAAFVRGDMVEWGPTQPKEMRRWRSDGGTDVWEDELWEQGLDMWDLVHGGEAVDDVAARFER
jgi:carboxylesterase type B